MDSMEARMKCLRIAAKAVNCDDGSFKDTVLAAAEEWSKFVIGEPLRESSGKSKQGDDVGRAPTHVP